MAFYDAIIADTADPDHLGRVRLQVPQVSGGAVTGWAQPMQLGWSAIGDQVFASFKGDDLSQPIFMPKASTSPWLPLTIASNFAPLSPTSGQPPMVRIRADGFLEFSGAVTALVQPQPLDTPITFATLPVSVPVPVPQLDQQQILASDIDSSLQAAATCVNWADTGTTASATYVSTLSGSAHTSGPTLSFVAPAGGSVIVSLGAESVGTVASGTGAVSYMSVRIIQGDGGGTIVTESDDLSAIQTGTLWQSVSTSFPVDSLIPGMNYSMVAYYRSGSTSNTVTYRRRWIRVDPVRPGAQPAVLVSVNTNGTLQVIFPFGTGTNDINLTGLVARYQ